MSSIQALPLDEKMPLTANHMMISLRQRDASVAGEVGMSSNAHALTVDRLGAWIASGEVGPGQAIQVEAQLGEQLGVSRTVIREAIKTLVAKGMLEVGPKVGTRVLPVRGWNLFDPQVVGWLAEHGLPENFVMDLLDLRRAIEPMAVRWACERATPAQIAGIQQAYLALAASLDDKATYNRADQLFHEAVLAASHNQFIEQMLPALGALLAISFEASSAVDALGETLPLHRDLAEAIASRDSARGVWACMSLIERAAATITEHYEK
jgi:DNA-binding FadR family transcriptional regulator